MAARDIGAEVADLPAGVFGSWLQGMQAALRGERGSDVPCDGCTACCTSSQFVHIGPAETDTLAHIPPALLFPAPGRPRGHLLMGYDEQGRCPMLTDRGCSIYEHRPATCRTYDCRVFPAAGLQLDDAEKVSIGRRARRWRFEFPSEHDVREREAVRAAAAFFGQHPGALPDGVAPSSTTQIAVLAVVVSDLFPAGEPPPDPDMVRAEVIRRSA